MNLDKYINLPSPGYVVEIYDDGKIIKHVIGNKSVLPNIEKTTIDTLYDIASLTKVFTSTLIYIAYEENKINIFDFVYNIDNNFINLKDVRVIDLLTHNQEVWTDGYLGDCETKEDFYNILYSAYVKSNIPMYIDVHYIILSTILEKIYGLDYKELCNQKIIKKLKLNNTTFEPDINNVASNNYENNNGKIVDYIYPGMIHDTKARKAKSLGITTGHASIFTTASDLVTFLKSFFDYSLLKKETIEFMLQHDDMNLYNFNCLRKISNKTNINDMYNDVSPNNINLYRTHNHMGTRYRNDIDYLNDVPLLASDNSISFSGFTGPMFTIDFDKKIIVVIMCNVIHNTKLNRQDRKNKIVEIMNLIFEHIKKNY